jgi:predicted glycoside hydrolase/deacetylase ChbG (UPF0249 family)
MARKHIKNLTHLSTHMFWPGCTPEIQQITDRLAREYNLPISIEGAKWAEIKWEWPKATAEQKEAAMAEYLGKVAPGLWIMVEHPGFDVPEMQALGIAPWYPNVAADRDGITRLFTSQRIREIIQRRGIELLSYGDAIRKMQQ